MNMRHRIETSKLFPIVAWTVVVCFALFTYFITLQVQAELDEISDGVNRLEAEISRTGGPGN